MRRWLSRRSETQGFCVIMAGMVCGALFWLALVAGLAWVIFR